MRCLTCLLLLCSFFHIQLFSQPCLPEGITFTTQAQIDSFPINYPGCTKIEGFVWIRGADISDLVGLNGLDTVLGSLTIGDSWKGVNPELITLEGLENLSCIGEDLVIHNNDNLVSIQALSGLNRIGKSIKILDNDHLMSLTGLEGIDSLSEMIDFQNNNALTNLTGLESLDSISNGMTMKVMLCFPALMVLQIWKAFPED